MKKIIGLLVLVLLIGCQAESREFYFEPIRGNSAHFVNNSGRTLTFHTMEDYVIGNIYVLRENNDVEQYPVNVIINELRAGQRRIINESFIQIIIRPDDRIVVRSDGFIVNNEGKFDDSLYRDYSIVSFGSLMAYIDDLERIRIDLFTKR